MTKILIDRSTVEQALKALKMMGEKYGEYACPACDHADAAIAALRERLAQPEPEPVGLLQEIARLHDRIKDLESDVEFLSLPAQRKPLTEPFIMESTRELSIDIIKLKEKNT